MSAHAEIISRHQSFIALFGSEDFTGMREFLTEDHVGMAPARPQMMGRDEAEAFWREGSEVAESAFTSHAQDVTVLGDTAIDRFGFVMKIAPRDGGPAIRDEGKCLWVWRREADGVWRLATAIWNSDSAEPALWSGG
jgi:ketosteroid isomerase-like protein